MRLQTTFASTLMMLILVGCGNDAEFKDIYTVTQKEVQSAMKYPSSVKFPAMSAFTEDKINDSLSSYKSDSLEILSRDLSEGGNISGYCYAQNGFGVYGTYKFLLMLGRNDKGLYAIMPPIIEEN